MSQVTGINSLPSELILDILKKTIPAKRPPRALAREISLSHVCAHWRTIILNEPLLWNKIEIYSSKSIERVSAYFERSNPIPVHVFFDVWKTDRIGRDSLEQLVDIAIERIDRWQRVRFFASRISTTRSFLSKIGDLAAPNLQEFRIVDDGPTQGDADDLLQPVDNILNGGHPQLQTVQIDQLAATSLISNLTTLHLREYNGTLFSVRLDTISALSQQCPSLSTLSIHGNFDHNSVTWNLEPTPALTMRSIKHLWLLTEDNLPGKLMTAVAFPNLHSLWLHCPYQTFIRSFTGHPYRPTFPKLKYLSVHNFEFYLCPELQQLFPHVNSLYFPGCNSWNTGLLETSLNAGWTEVTQVVLRTRGDMHPKKFTKHLVDSVAARRRAGMPIRQILLDRDALRCFSKDGVVVPEDIRPVFDELTEENYGDPWWIITKTDKGIFN